MSRRDRSSRTNGVVGTAKLEAELGADLCRAVGRVEDGARDLVAIGPGGVSTHKRARGDRQGGVEDRVALGELGSKRVRLDSSLGEVVDGRGSEVDVVEVDNGAAGELSEVECVLGGQLVGGELVLELEVARAEKVRGRPQSGTIKQRAALVEGLGDGRLASLEELGVERLLDSDNVLRVPGGLDGDALGDSVLGLQQRRHSAIAELAALLDLQVLHG